MRVVVVSTSFPAHAEDPSGHFVATHARQLELAGDHVTVIVPGAAQESLGDPRFPSQVQRLGASRLFRWPGVVPNLRRSPALALLAPSFCARAREAIVGVAPQRIIAHFAIPSGFPICFGLRAPLEVWWHGADARLVLAMPIAVRKRFLSFLCQRAEQLVFVSHTLREAIAAAVPERARTTFERIARVKLAPIHLPPRTDLPRPAAAPQGDYFVWCGRDVPEKNLDLAIDAARNAKVHLVVIGALRPQAEGLTFLGPIARSIALSWIAHARCLVSTSRVEAAPTVVREARAYGVPVLATAAGDLAHWAAQDAGIMLAPHHASGIAALLRKISNETTQQALRSPACLPRDRQNN